MTASDPRPVVQLDSPDLDIRLVGGKGINLAKMISSGFSVPYAFAVTVDAYEMFLDRNGLRDRIREVLDSTDFDDEASLESASEEIRSMFLDADIEAEELVDLKKQRGALDGEYFAVRSSAVAEDLADASFAGQQDTYLNVRREDVVRMILTCWASYWNARAMKYRHDASKDHLSQGMAVVVQRMVNSDISGVMFTADPVSGEDDIIIEASWGLGESIVSGLVTPDRYVLSKDGRVMEAEVRSKEKGFYLVGGQNLQVDIPPEKVDARCADDKILKRIAQEGMKLESHFECPQDIEWAVEDGKVYILQSRAITTLPDASERDGILWSRGYGDEYWADATTPMFYTVMGKLLTDYVNHEGAHMMGYKDLESGPLTKLHKSRVYFSATVLERIFAHYPKFIRSRELLEYFPRAEQERIAKYPNDYAGAVKSQLCLMVRDRDGMIWRTDKVYRQWAQGFLKLCDEFDSQDLKAMSDDELADWYFRIREGSIKHYQLIRYGMVSHSIMTNLLVKNWCAKWLGDDGTIYAGLMCAPDDNKTVETNKGFSDMGKALRAEPDVFAKSQSMPAAEFVEWLQTSDCAFKDVYNSFIKEFGHRSGTRELYAPRWAEDPEYVMGVAAQMYRSGADLREEFERSVERRKETEADVRKRLNPFKRAVMSKVLSYARTYLTFRENQRFYLDHMMYRNRLIFLEQGRRLSEKGLIDEREDIFFLEDDEAIAILRGGDASGIREKIAPRKAEFMKYRDRLPPKFILNGVDFDDEPITHGDVLVGAASSPGRYTGKVRVIMDVRDLGQVEKGEILVTSNTDPGWTVVFSKLGGLITETGGILCHGAVISREYRIPAVTAVKSATAILHTGDTVSVDGSTGEVEILEAKGMSQELDWNESYYFNLHDQGNGLTVFMRIGNKPNRDEKSVFLFAIEGDRICGLRNAVKCDDDRKACCGLRFQQEEDAWHITFQGPLFDIAKEPAPIVSSMDLVWKPVNPVMDYHDCVDAKGAELSSKTVSEHFEQFGAVSGKVAIGDRTYDVTATGERDMSEGVRDWGSPKMWMWLNSVYGTDVGFNATKLCTDMGDVDAGYVGNKDSNDPVVKIDIEVGYESGIPASYTMRMRGKSGKEYAVEAKILRKAFLPMQGSKDMLLVEAISETVMDGRTGYGIAEFLVPAPKQRGDSHGGDIHVPQLRGGAGQVPCGDGEMHRMRRIHGSDGQEGPREPGAGGHCPRDVRRGEGGDAGRGRARAQEGQEGQGSSHRGDRRGRRAPDRQDLRQEARGPSSW